MMPRELDDDEKRIWHCLTRHIVKPNHRIKSTAQQLEATIKHFPSSTFPPQSASIPLANVNVKRTSEPIDLLANDMHHLSRATAKQVVRGKRKVDATLDLHGFGHDQAMHQFQQFLHDHSKAGNRLLRVITGYGKMTGGNGVLRNALPRWINFAENRRLILSFHQAKPQDGGAGAWLILLKRMDKIK